MTTFIKLIAALLISGCSAVHAAPTYESASAVMAGMKRFIATELLLGGQPGAQRRAAMLAAADVVRQGRAVFGEDVFGTYGACVKATQLFQVYAQDAGALARVVAGESTDTNGLLGAHRFAFEFGDAYRLCRQSIEDLQSTAGRSADVGPTAPAARR